MKKHQFDCLVFLGLSISGLVNASVSTGWLKGLLLICAIVSVSISLIEYHIAKKEM
jgi:hypothetical protein